MAFGIKLHCWGEWACFTRPEMKVERVSYDAMTPSAARGVVEAIYWKPEIRWHIDRITVLKPIQFTSVRRNEVKDKIGAGAAKAMKDDTGNLAYCVDDNESGNRQQRATLMLRDVGYIIEAHIEILRGPDNIAKHLDQFNRRARKGSCFTRPYLGCREFAADFELLEDENAVPNIHESLSGERDLGWMLHDIDFSNIKDKQAKFFHAVMRDGVIDVEVCARAGVVA
jgi:CRISPR-associated protein Cas5d